MDIIRSMPPADPGQPMSASWLRGPAQDDTLDVAFVSFRPGAATPPHVHHGGQTLVIVSGRGFVEVEGVRTEVSAGDVVITPPHEPHVHGATDDSPMTHLSVTTGRNDVAGSGQAPAASEPGSRRSAGQAEATS